MNTSNNTVDSAFAVWITGLPASGKTTIAKELLLLLRTELKLSVAHLESDRLRPILTPNLTYSESERNRFYQGLALLAALLIADGIPVVIDATGNRRAYRDAARGMIHHFLEVFVSCPLDVCVSRDPKGLYGKAGKGVLSNLPGLQDPYEEPLAPDITITSNLSSPLEAARIIRNKLMTNSWI